MNIAEKYVDGLKKAYYEVGGKEQWDDFENVMHGASKEDMEKLQALYPDIPESLLQLLELVDGTYWREYGGEKVAFYFLGSDVEEYPYYLLSAQQMIKNKDKFPSWGDYLIDRDFDDVPVDERIIDDVDSLCWLHFSDCMNNGGTSQLFIDFSPSEKGKKGQIVRFLHDPDELIVIADSFDAYLQMLMENEYEFITDETVEEWD